MYRVRAHRGRAKRKNAKVAKKLVDRGKSIARWYPQSRYKPHELASPGFTKLRTEFLQRNPQLTGLIAALQLDDTLH